MKRILLVFCLIAIGLLEANGQQYYMSAPQGFGAGTTGGGNAAPATVSNETDLKAALTASGSGVILVSGTITLTAQIRVKVIDKTVVGLPGAKLVNTIQTQTGSGILYLQNGSSNVIIRNLIFEGPAAYDINGNDNLTADGVNQLWVDHCEFQDGLDGNFDIKGNSDNVTVSWCKFTYLKAPVPGGSGGSNDHRFSDLVGSGGTDAPIDGHFSVTFQNCYWAIGCKERMPRARNAELHILNCYYNTYSSGTTALGLGGGTNNLTCYVENSHFASIGTIYKNYNGTDGGTHTLTFTGCINYAPDVGIVAPPTYSYTAYPASEVAGYVGNTSCGAGATLEVTSSGVISTSCINAGIFDGKEFSSFAIYPNPSNSTFTVMGREDIASLTILNMVGEEVYRNDAVNHTHELKVNADLEEGVYLVKIQYASGNAGVAKFVKSKE